MRAGLLALLIIGLQASSVSAEEDVASVLELNRQVRATGPPTSAPRTLRAFDPVRLGDRVTTGPRAFVALRFSAGTRFLSASENSSFGITGSPGVTRIALSRGMISYDVIQSAMRPGQVDAISTPHAVVHVQGVVVVALDSGRLGTATPFATDVYLLSGDARVEIPGRREVVLKAKEGLRVGAGGPARTRTLSLSEIARVRWHLEVITPMGSRSPMALVEAPLSARLAIQGDDSRDQRPRDWTLVIDDGRGFGSWVGTSSEGCVAGDCTFGLGGLQFCEPVASGLARQGIRAACARPVGPDVDYRDDVGRRLARGPLAGRLVVFEPVSEVRDTTTPGWRLMRVADRRRIGTAGEPILGLSECDARLRTPYPSGLACVRMSPVEGIQYFDARGDLMAAGPFAGGMIVYEY